jgi:hypothetical protein
MTVAAFTEIPAAEPADVLPGAPRPAIGPRVRPVPALEPPYDPLDGDDRPHLTLLAGPEPLPFDDLPSPHRPLAQPAPRRTRLGQQFWGPQPTRRKDLPDPRPVAHRFLQASVEALAGRRPATQLQQWTSPAVFADLSRALRSRRIHAAGATPTVLSVHVSEPADGVAEVCAVIRHGERARAAAARLEGVDGRWRCVALQLG